jgi:hypothetical protein
MFDFDNLAKDFEENQEILKIRRKKNIFEEEYQRQYKNVAGVIRQSRYDIVAYMDKLAHTLETIREDGDILDVEYGDPFDDPEKYGGSLEIRFSDVNYSGSYKLRYIFTTEKNHADMLHDAESWLTERGFWTLDCGISGEKLGDVMRKLVQIFEPNKNTGLTDNFEDLMKRYVIAEVKQSDAESPDDFRREINCALTEFRNMWLRYYYMLQSLRKFDKVVFFFTKNSFCVWDRKFESNLD